MARYRFSKWIMAGAALAQLSFCAVVAPPAQAFTNRNLVHGSQGYDVDELQSRLGFLGYYHHKVDGNFGWSTYWAVRDFQYAFGMNPTGVVDMQTKIALVDATKAWHYQPASNLNVGSSAAANPSANTGSPSTNNSTNNPTAGQSSTGQPPTGQPGGQAAAATAATPSAPISGVSPADQTLLAHVVYAEARGEPFIGQVAVAAVVLNRMRSPKFPHSIPAIIYQPQAFTSVQDGQINLTPNAEAYKAVADALSGWDPADGATYYFNPATATSSWIWSKPEILQIGHHIFCR